MSDPIQNNLSPPRRLDVGHLSTAAWDSRSPVWWGNLLLMCIETTTIVLMIAAYFYLRRNEGQWPPPRINAVPILGEPKPDLLWGTLNLALIVPSCVLMYWCDTAARRSDEKGVRIWLSVMLAVALAAIAVRFYEFRGVHVRWSDNAYGSAVWWILGLHLSYLLAAAGEFLILLLWVFTHEFDEHHALDVTLAGGFWYWLAGTWVVCYLVLYWVPRWM